MSCTNLARTPSSTAQSARTHTRNLAQAEKAARTVAMLTERLDDHRNQGKRQIVVQHTTTTVNADSVAMLINNTRIPKIM